MLMTLNGHSGSWDGVLITPRDKKKIVVALSGEEKGRLNIYRQQGDALNLD